MVLSHSIDNLLVGKDLDKKEALRFFASILAVSPNKTKEAETALVLLHKKIETANELTALVQVARRKQVKLTREKKIRSFQNRLIDGCGTGGDGRNTFNISTVACIVAAGAGAYVAKHGNRSITSRCGSSDLMETLGVKLEQTPKQLGRAIQNARMAYFHAPYYTKAFKNIQLARKNLSTYKLKTVFNLIGPLLNPAQVKRQMIGVFHPRYLKPMVLASKQMKLHHVLIISGQNKTDELVTEKPGFAAELKDGRIKFYSINGAELGLKKNKSKDLIGGTSETNSRIALNILTGKDYSARRDVVLLNAAALLYISGLAKNLKEGVRLAVRSIDSKTAVHILATLKRISNDST